MMGASNEKERDMANDKRRSNKEVRKPKKAQPPKQNASNPSLKGTPVAPAPKRV